MLSVPNGNEFEEALDGLDLCVALDFYITVTTARCDYVLPVHDVRTRRLSGNVPDLPGDLVSSGHRSRRGAGRPARTEWEIIDDLMQRMRVRTPVFTVMSGARKLLSLFGVRLSPRLLIDAMIRLAAGGNRFGLRRDGLTFRRLTQQHPHGVVLAPHLRTDVLGEVVAYQGGRIRLVHDDIAAEVAALVRREEPEGFPLRLIGVREPRSENSWMHNSPLLMRGGRGHHALMHVDDAAELQICDGDAGAGEFALRPDHSARHGDQGSLSPGVIADPTWLGAQGHWGVAARQPRRGANVNKLSRARRSTWSRCRECPG